MMRNPRKLCQGSYGTVYRVRESCSDYAAIKVQPYLDREDRTLAELRYLKSVDHPNIVQFYGHCFCDNKFYIVMELLEFSFQDFLGTLSIPDVIQVLHDVAAGQFGCDSLSVLIIANLCPFAKIFLKNKSQGSTIY